MKRWVRGPIPIRTIGHWGVLAFMPAFMLVLVLTDPGSWFFWVMLAFSVLPVAGFVWASLRDHVAWVDDVGISWRTGTGEPARIDWADVDSAMVVSADGLAVGFRRPTGDIRAVESLTYPWSETGLARASAQTKRLASMTSIRYIQVGADILDPPTTPSVAPRRARHQD